MKRLLAVLLLWCAAPLAHAVPQYEYAYRPDARDLSFASIVTGSGYTANASAFKAYIRNATPAISACALTDTSAVLLGATQTRGCAFPAGPTLNVRVRTPAAVTPSRPVIYLLSAWGNAAADTVGSRAQADGYVVVELTYQYWVDALAPLYGAGGFTPVWGRVAALVADQVEPVLPAHTGSAVISSATGSLVAPYFLLWRDPPRAVVTNGVLLSLDWLRRNYRVGPNYWDLGYVNSYAPVFLTMAPAPTQWQMGTTDAFWPNTAPLPNASRGQGADEAFGLFSTLERGWTLSGGDADLYLGAQGHLEPDYAAAIAFIAAH